MPMRTDRFSFDLVAIEKTGLLSRRVTIRVTNTSGSDVDEATVTLTVSADGDPVETFSASLGSLAPDESREVARTLSVSVGEGMALKTHGADLSVAVVTDGAREETEGSLSV